MPKAIAKIDTLDVDLPTIRLHVVAIEAITPNADRTALPRMHIITSHSPNFRRIQQIRLHEFYKNQRFLEGSASFTGVNRDRPGVRSGALHSRW